MLKKPACFRKQGCFTFFNAFHVVARLLHFQATLNISALSSMVM